VLNSAWMPSTFSITPSIAFSQNNGATTCIDCTGGNNGHITNLENGSTMRQYSSPSASTSSRAPV